MNPIYIGYDSRESIAYQACIESLRATASSSFVVQPINSRFAGLDYKRPEEIRKGVRWDVVSDAPMATEFSIARFFVPLLQRTGWALYCDCDFLFRDSVDKLFALADDRYEVMVVKHDYPQAEGTKMDGQIQTVYPRKNWSSLMLLNCDRINRRSRKELLTVLNEARGLLLHQFSWVADSDLGELPVSWNWLEGISDSAIEPQAVHFTRGIPSMPGYENSAYADEWRKYANR